MASCKDNQFSNDGSFMDQFLKKTNKSGNVIVPKKNEPSASELEELKRQQKIQSQLEQEQKEARERDEKERKRREEAIEQLLARQKQAEENQKVTQVIPKARKTPFVPQCNTNAPKTIEPRKRTFSQIDTEQKVAETGKKQKLSNSTSKELEIKKSEPEPSSTPTPIPTQPDIVIPKSNLGHKLLLKMGWSQGSGLGLNGDGRVSIVEPGKVKLDKAGISADTNTEKEEDPTDIYSMYKQRMKHTYKERPNPMGNPRQNYYS